MPAIRMYWPAINIVGPGAIAELAAEIQTLGWKKPMLVTDKPLVKLGIAAKVEAVLKQAGVPYVVYDEPVPNPTMKNVMDGVALFKKEGCDSLVSLGGGSPQDAAKAIAIIMTNGGVPSDYEGINKSKKPGLPIVAINTTAGTASEVTKNYVITDEIRKIKMVMVDPHCTPVIGVNDPELMLGIPAALTAATGMDALTHAIESYVSVGAFGLSKTLSLESIRLISESLETAVKTGGDLEARDKMAWASYIAGLSFNNAGLGIVHSLAHQLGSEYDLPHGVANAILMPYVEAFNAETCPERFVEIARAMGGKVDGLTDKQAAKLAVDAMFELARKVGIPDLKDTRFRPEDAPRLAEQAMRDVCTGGNPRPVTVKDLEALYLRCYRREV